MTDIQQGGGKRKKNWLPTNSISTARTDKAEDMKIYIGIDPGQTGAMAIIGDGLEEIYDFDDGDSMTNLRLVSADQVKAVIEKVAAMPKQGVSSTFKFGTNFGIWIGRLEALGIPFDYVTPQKWKKEMFDSMPRSGDQKAMSLDRARRLFPEMRDQLKRKKDHNRADALLLAEYCRRMDK